MKNTTIHVTFSEEELALLDKARVRVTGICSPETILISRADFIRAAIKLAAMELAKKTDG